MSLVVKGALFPNEDGSNRLFEIAMLNPGDPVELIPDPKNKVDPNAVAVFSMRGYQIGFLSAERCGFVGGQIRAGRDVKCVFQKKTADGAIIRANFDGAEPLLPSPIPEVFDPHLEEQMKLMAAADPDSGFYPDYVPPDD